MSGKRGAQKLSRLQIVVLVLTAAGAILATLAGSRTTDSNTGIFFMEHVAGDVVFDHTKHAERSTECAACHHPLWKSATEDLCEACHGDEVEADFFDHTDYLELHDSDCSTCHQEADDENAISCRTCHPPAQVEAQATRGCADCHDFDRDEDPLVHDDLIELHDDCGTCHAPRAVGAVYHDQCTACHVTTDPTRFRTGEGTVVCGWCHLR